jgi:TfoX/Sxy family transcriptional regulator of competence genes
MDDKAAKVEAMRDMLHEAILQIDPQITLTHKQMFGGAGFWANGTIFAAWFGNTIALKLNDADRETLLAIDGAQPGMMGKYVETPPAFADDSSQLTVWVRKSFDFVLS